MTSSGKTQTKSVTRALSKALLGVIVAANVAVWGAWLFRERLVDAGVLPPPPATRVDLAPLPLPPITERAVAEAAPAAPDDSDTPVETPSPGPEAVLVACAVAGPYQSYDAALALEQRLAATGARVELLADAAGPRPEFLVFIDPLPSLGEALDLTRALRAGLVPDAFAITSGSHENGVAVGLFRDLARARAMRDRMVAHGHGVDIRPQRDALYQVRVRNAPPAALASVEHEICDEDGVSGTEPAP